MNVANRSKVAECFEAVQESRYSQHVSVHRIQETVALFYARVNRASSRLPFHPFHMLKPVYQTAMYVFISEAVHMSRLANISSDDFKHMGQKIKLSKLLLPFAAKMLDVTGQHPKFCPASLLC